MLSNTKVIKSVLAALLLHLLLVVEIKANAVSVSFATSDVDIKLNITSSAEDYETVNQREYAENIRRMDEALSVFRFDFESETNTIITQRDLFLTKLREVDQRLFPLRFLSDLDKHCVQKYEKQITSSTWVNTTITACVTAALKDFDSYIYTPTNTRNTLNSYYAVNLVANLNTCKKNNPVLDSQNYTICATKAITDADSVTASYTKTFTTQMKNSRCSADSRVRTAIDCSFTVVHDTSSTVGATNSQIQRCAQGLEFCPQCDTPKPVFYCANQLSVSLNVSDYRNPTIANPFYGLTGKIDCVLLNLGEPSWK